MTASRRHSLLATWFLCVGLGAPGIGCDDGASSSEAKADGDAKAAGDAKADGDAKSDAKADGDAKAAGDAKAGGDAKALPSDADVDEQVAKFMKDQRKMGCEMLPPAMVAKALEVPEGELKQQKIMGCIYSWKNGDEQTGEASIMSIWVKDTPKQARTWFDNMTKNKTPEELAAEMAMVQKKLEEKKALDKVGKKAAGDIGKAMTGMTPDEGYEYEDVEGLGDAARVKTYDGSVTVLVGNMLFNVRAYKGEPVPPPDMEAIMSRDIAKITADAKKSEAEHMDKTRDVRRAMSVALAKEIVAAL